MPLEGTRRSSRVPKQIAILVVGSDMEGRVFSERTKTVVLSRHGAGIISEYKLSAEQELVIRRIDTNKEAEIRVVGQLASESGVYTYGVAFLDPSLDFWGIDFPAPTDEERLARRTVLQCVSCKGHEIVEQSDLESDVFAINKSIMRFCKRCGSSTIWQQAVGSAAPEPAPPLAKQAPEPEPDWAPQPSRFTPRSAYSDSPAPADPAAPAKSSIPARSPDAAAAGGRRENRRKHVRTKVRFKACVRCQSSPDEIVTCEDMSRGGVRFKSRKRYTEQTMIEIAVPYEPGNPSIFVSARIVFVQELADEKLFRYGVAYLR